MKILFKKYVYKRTTVQGMYYPESATIVIRSTLTLTHKIITFVHELGHYFIDKCGGDTNVDYVYDVICVLLDPCYKKKKTVFRWLCKYYYEE